MEKPPNCDFFTYKLMKSCWKFQDIIRKLLRTISDTKFLEKFKESSFYFNQSIYASDKITAKIEESREISTI